MPSCGNLPPRRARGSNPGRCPRHPADQLADAAGRRRLSTRMFHQILFPRLSIGTHVQSSGHSRTAFT